MDITGEKGKKVRDQELRLILQDDRETRKGGFIPKKRHFSLEGLEFMVGDKEMLKCFRPRTAMIICKVQICS